MVRAETKENPLNATPSAAPVVTVGPVKFGNDLPISIIAGPCAAREPRACAGSRERAEGDRGPAQDRARLQDLVRQGQPHQRAPAARGIGLTQALPIFAEIRSSLGLPVLTDVHEACAMRRGRAGGRRVADPGLPVPADRSAAGGRGDRQGRQRQEGAVPGALGHGQRRRQDHRRRQSATCW